VADKIELKITGEDKHLKKVIKSSEKLVKRFTKTAKNATKRRETAEKKTAKDIRRAQIAEVKRTIAQDERLFHKRAKNRLKKYKQELSAAKKLEAEKSAATRKAVAMDRRLSKKRARNRLKQMKARQRAEIRKERAHVRRMRKIRAGIGRGVGRLGMVGGIGGLVGGIGLVYKAREILDFDVKLASLADQAGITRKEQLKLRDTLTDTAIATGVQRDVILDSVRRIVDKSGEYKIAADNVEKLAMAIRGTQVDPIALGETVAAIAFSFKGQGQPVFDFLEMLVAQGDKASITLMDMAANGEMLMGAFKRAGLTGVKDFMEFFALTQIAGGGGTSPEAATMMKNLVVQIKKRARLNFGDVPGGKKLAQTLMGPSGLQVGFGDAVKMILETAKGDMRTISQMFPNIRGSAPLELLIPEFRRTGGNSIFDMLVKVAKETKEGSVLLRKYQRVAETPSQGFERLLAVITKLADVALLPSLNAISDSIIELVENKDKMDELVQTFKDFGDTLALIARSGAAVANIVNPILKERRRRIDLKKEMEELSLWERMKARTKMGFAWDPQKTTGEIIENIRMKKEIKSRGKGNIQAKLPLMNLNIVNNFSKEGKEQTTTVDANINSTRGAVALAM
jgi:hypothetical protein